MEQFDQANLTLGRLLPRLSGEFPEVDSNSTEWKAFLARLETHFPRLFTLLLQLYGDQYDFFYHLEQLLFLMVKSWLQRPAALKALDKRRQANPAWFESNQMLGGVCYVDLFAQNLKGIE